MNQTRSMSDTNPMFRRVLSGVLFAAMAAVSGCGSAPPAVMTTTIDRTTTQQSYPIAPPPTSVTTTRTQQYTP